ncbi:MAG: LDL receptor domain-containing protein [Polyangiales bacterium]
MHLRFAMLSLILCSSACSGGGRTSLPTADSASAAAQALMRSLVVAGGKVKPGGLPDASNQIAMLLPQATDPLVPGGSTLMPLDVDNADEATNPAQSVLMQFDGASDHFDVPVSASSSGPAHLDFQLSTKPDACKDLCNKTFTIAMQEALTLADGTVSTHAMHDMQLDCRKLGDAARCASAASSSKGSAGKGSVSAKDAGAPTARKDDAGAVQSGLGDGGLAGLGFDASGLLLDASSVPDFVCTSGAHVPYTALCNGTNDCPDGSDELACGDASLNAFGCPSGGTVALTKLCDGVQDCKDGFDEMVCIPCTDGMGNYSPLQRCDGKLACKDGSDEMSCDFPCTSGENVPITKLCDGVKDCKDGSDETLCGSDFPCGDGTSVPTTKLCDGVMDCKNGADEAKPMCP